MVKPVIKICGLTGRLDAASCTRLGADLVGFIFHPPSPRSVEPLQVKHLKTPGCFRVGVFISQKAPEILAVMDQAQLDLAQLHGEQDLEDARAVGPERVIKVFWPERYEDKAELAAEMEKWAPAASLFLFDSGTSGGGHNRKIGSLAGLSRSPKPYLLAGGLTPEDLSRYWPNKDPMFLGLDFNSGVEIRPGVKSREAIQNLMAALVRVSDKDAGSMKKSPMAGYFGEFGGQYVPEVLMPPLEELEEAMSVIRPTPGFQAELTYLLTQYAGRPTPLTRCPKLSEELGLSIRLKREDLLHTGAHKINNTLGQALLAKKMGKTELVAETGAGQHGVATATAAARLGLNAVIFMGEVDVVRQKMNVERMKLLGARVIAVKDGTRTLKDAINEALRYWLTNQKTTHYCFGTSAGPHPFPTLVRDFQAIISKEAKEQYSNVVGRLPDVVVAAVGGGSNSIGAFANFISSKVRLVGVEAAGSGEIGCYNSAPINLGRLGILHGQRSMLLQTRDGQVLPSHSISAGLDYPSVGPEHAYLHSIGRVEYGLANDREALEAFMTLTRTEGIIPALESSHALAWVIKNKDRLSLGAEVMICLSGRGDKDLEIVLENLKVD